MTDDHPRGCTPAGGAYIAGHLADGRGVRIHHARGRITAIEPDPAAPARWLVPGLIDLQVNGLLGLDVNAADLTTDVIHDLVRAEARCGVTGFCPTLVTAAEDRLSHALAVIARARQEDGRTRHAVLGVHVEGPYLCAEDGPRGAHDPAALRVPSTEEFDRWQRAAGGAVRIVTLAPELPGAMDYIRHIRDRGTIAAVGHTGASAAQIRAAADAGAKLSTHLGNGAHAMLPRHPNYLWAQLAETRLAASFIADGHHLPADTFLAMVRAKGTGRRILVSDSVALAGCAPGTYQTPVGGTVTLHPDGRLVLGDTDLLAGSACTLLDCARWAVRRAGLDLGRVAAMASSGPAALLGLTDRGQFEVGAWADVAVLTDELEPVQTIVRGEVVHQTGP
jgi:N-acetylglucosamine-6-phosphate deacetylase